MILHDGDILIADVMRFFHGDGPTIQFEAGNQKGGHYFCPNSDVNYIQTDDINQCYQLPITALSSKQTNKKNSKESIKRDSN